MHLLEKYSLHFVNLHNPKLIEGIPTTRDPSIKELIYITTK